jgi:nuclear pore complex protein Nup205
MVGLVQLLLKSNASNSLIEDYAACLEARSEESQNVENNNNNNNNDPGILILQVRLHPFHLFVSRLLFFSFILKCCLYIPSTCFQLLIDNISRPAPNITHLLLRFNLDMPVERTVLQPKFYSGIVHCLSLFNILILSNITVLLKCYVQLHEGYS